MIFILMNQVLLIIFLLLLNWVKYSLIVSYNPNMNFPINLELDKNQVGAFRLLPAKCEWN